MKIVLLLTLCTFGNFAVAKQFAGKKMMNGFSLESFEGFESSWNFVTIRYRHDTGEMRWTYANELAWKVLESGNTSYPDGAVFGKVSVKTMPDPLFESSVVPSGARRYQFMIRDQKKYESTGGWGYVLFDGHGKTYDEDPKHIEQACYACHQLASDRGEVFSQMMSKKFAQSEKYSTDKAVIQFESKEVSKLPKLVRLYLPKETRQVKKIVNVMLVEHLFQGTLDEIKPTLEKEVKSSGLPAILLSSNQQRFSLTFKTKIDGCSVEKSFQNIMTTKNVKSPVLSTKYCAK